MNMILHNNPTALIKQGNTLSTPLFMTDRGDLKTFNFVIANPPFSDKRWSTGFDPQTDLHERFKHYGVPPNKQGDYAYLLHIVRSLKIKGKGACILPHGVLFRGNVEATIRRNLVRQGFIKGIIGLPANLFYGTGIPACIVVLDKENAHNRKGIFMIDASKGFIKEGPKNRLRSQDIHKIVDVFKNRLEIDKYSRMVSIDEIEQKHNFNLNLPRYIDSLEPEDIQDIEGHLRGGIPSVDIDALGGYWTVCPNLRTTLFKDNRPGYLDLAVSKEAIKPTIYEHPEFVAYMKVMEVVFTKWQQRTIDTVKALEAGCHPKLIIKDLSEDLLAHYADKPLIDNYDIYQHLMDYWAEIMQDDCYMIAADGWQAETYRVLEKAKSGKNKGKEVDKGWACDLVPKEYIVRRYFSGEQAAIQAVEAELEPVYSQQTELEEEHGGEEGAFGDLEKINKAAVSAQINELAADTESEEDMAILKRWLNLATNISALKSKIKTAEAELDTLAYAKFPELTKDEIKALVVDDKWLTAIDDAIHGELDRISQALTVRVKELTERYETPMPSQTQTVTDLEKNVKAHLAKMGFSWN